MPRGTKRAVSSVPPPSYEASWSAAAMARDPQFRQAVKKPKFDRHQVLHIVMEQKLQSCDNLLDHAQHLCRESQDRRLLDYCVTGNGLPGVRAGLSTVVDAGMRFAENGEEEANPPEDQRPLSAERLLELKAIATGNMSRLQAVRIDKPHACLDHYTAQGRFTVAPRNGTWSFRNFFEVLVAGRADPALAGLSLAAVSEGGFSLPCSEGSWKEMQKPGSMGANYYGAALVRKPYAEVDKYRCDQQLRFDQLPHELIPWADVRNPDAWIEEMPKFQKFEVSVPVSSFDLRAKFYVEAERMIALIRAFERAGHRITHTVGVKLEADLGWKVTAKRGKATRHKHSSPQDVDSFVVGGA